MISSNNKIGRVAFIHQPYFCPWLGFFNKLFYADVYISLDDVNFSKRHYIGRSKIINMHGEPHWLSLPTGENFGSKINAIFLQNFNHNYFSDLLKTIDYSYAKAKYYSEEWGNLKRILLNYFSVENSLNKKNVYLIKELLTYLAIPSPNIVFSSSLELKSEDSTKRIYELLRTVNCNTIIIGSGASIKVHNWREIIGNGINVYIIDYLKEHPHYNQLRRRRSGFIPGLSIIDSLLNQGKEKTRNFILKTIKWQKVDL